MPHIHGVAWIADWYLKKKNFKEGFLCGVDSNAILSEEEKQRVTDLADELVSCQLMELPSDTERKKVVNEVQKHNHTPSCRKYNGQCRYGFPKLPSFELEPNLSYK